VSSRFSTEMLLVLGALFAIVAGHYAIQPMIESARRGEGGPSFAVLHGVASAFFLVKFAAVAGLAWRLTAPRAPRPTPLRLLGRLLEARRAPPRRALERAAGASRMLPTTVTFLTCGRWLPLFENLSTLTTFGPGMRPSFSASPSAPAGARGRAACRCAGSARAERLAQLGEKRFAGCGRRRRRAP
jgi:hypothetical protein